MQIRRIALKTVDGLSPLPMSSAWVRDGLFVIGMDRSNFSYKIDSPTWLRFETRVKLRQ